MKVNKYFLSKIIKEEIKNILYEDDNLERKLVQFFVKYRNYLTKHPTHNKEVVTDIEKELKNIAPSLSGPQILQMLDGKIDRQLLSFISNLLKRDKRMSSFSDKLDNYEMSITPDEQNVYQVYNKQDPDPGFMRVPKDDEAYDQEDVRKDIKTLVTEEIKSLNEADISGDSGIYGIVLEQLQPLSKNEEQEFDKISGYWLDPNVAKYTKNYLKTHDYARLLNAVKQIHAAVLNKKIRYDPKRLESAKRAIASSKKFDKELLNKLSDPNGVNAELLKKKGLEVLRPLGEGHDGVVYELTNGKALKITTNKEEGAAANKVLQSGNKKHIVQVYDVFYFTKDQVNNARNTTPALEEQVTGVAAPGGARRVQARQAQPTPAPAQQKTIKPPKEQQPKVFSQEDIGQEQQALEQSFNNFDIKAILQDLKDVGLYYPDFHSGNLMKRGDTYVVTDLGHAKPGIPVTKALAEKRKYIKNIILQVLYEQGK